MDLDELHPYIWAWQCLSFDMLCWNYKTWRSPKIINRQNSQKPKQIQNAKSKQKWITLHVPHKWYVLAVSFQIFQRKLCFSFSTHFAYVKLCLQKQHYYKQHYDIHMIIYKLSWIYRLDIYLQSIGLSNKRLVIWLAKTLFHFCPSYKIMHTSIIQRTLNPLDIGFMSNKCNLDWWHACQFLTCACADILSEDESFHSLILVYITKFRPYLHPPQYI